MAFFNFRRNTSTPDSGKPEASPDKGCAGKNSVSPATEELSRRARQRLIGATVLVVAAVIVFPLVFSAPPRSVPADMAIDIAGSSSASVAVENSLSADEEVIVAEPAASVALAQLAASQTPDEATLRLAEEEAARARAADEEAARKRIEQEREAQARAERERADKAARDQAAAEKAAADKAARDKAAEEKAARDKAARDKAAAEKEAAEKAAADKAAREKAARDKAAADKAAAEKAARDKAAAEKAARDKAAAEKAAADKAAREKAAADKAAAEKAAAANRPGADFPATGRFVVQVGAFVEDGKVAAVRRQLSAAGLNNYTQVVKINGKDVTRVRMGPFSTRKEMDRVADKVRSLGLPVSVYSY
ncbi:SPOR domain-containing protein [Brachymonas sp. G13]|uniref:SPOR domain-containing protein n=1 Tax=Brachymonas wangyanguii TaxID=3130163 RepID=UPI00307F3B61